MNLVEGPHCPFCTDHVCARSIAENETAFAIEDQYPVTDGHALVLPKRHVSDVFELTDEEVRDAAALLHQCRRASALGQRPAVARTFRCASVRV